MKRPVALVLTIVIFTAIAVCFLRSGDENPDFGNVPKVAGYGCWEAITDCTGDTDLLTIDAIDWSRSTDGSIAVRTTPACLLSLTSQPLDSEGFATGDPDERGRCGYAEKKTGRKWEYVGEICVDFAANAGYGFGDSQTPDAFFSFVLSDEDRWTWQELKIQMPEYEPGTTYRITYFLRQELDSGWSNELHSVSHTVKLPKQTNKRFDFVDLGWRCSTGSAVRPEIRVNYGEVPYFLLDESYQEYKENGRWMREELFAGELRHPDDKAIYELTPCSIVPNQYMVTNYQWHVFAHNEKNPPTDYRLTLVFCDNADGSGEQYTLTLYLNTDMLSEYR